LARKPRVRSASGIYHVILRGNNKQNIFEDEEDREFFLKKLTMYKERCGIEIYAYCLMDNHVHLLIKEGDLGISDVMKRLASSYAYWFNRKYGRIGHLYQERFKSEPVENERYFLAVIRYIHNNPVKAGMVKKCEDYAYSSYMDYLKKNSIISKDICMGLMSKNDYITFHNKSNKDECMEIKDTIFRFLTDSNALKVIKSILSCENINILVEMERNVRDDYIRIFRRHGISIKQIARLTGLSEGIVRRQRLRYV